MCTSLDNIKFPVIFQKMYVRAPKSTDASELATTLHSEVYDYTRFSKTWVVNSYDAECLIIFLDSVGNTVIVEQTPEVCAVHYSVPPHWILSTISAHRIQWWI